MKNSQIDYRYYKLSVKEKVLFGLLFVGGSVTALYMFFAIPWLGIVVGVPFLPLFYKKLAEYFRDRRISKLEEEFCMYMQLTAASLAGGTSFENVFREVAESAPESTGVKYMDKEFIQIDRLISLNYDSRQAFASFAERTGSTDIKSMASALEGVSLSGGSLVGLVRGAVSALRLKQDTEREIKRVISLPKMNHKIMTAMPFAFVILLKMLSPEFIGGLYSGVGRIVMVIVTALMVIAWFLGSRFSTIKY